MKKNIALIVSLFSILPATQSLVGSAAIHTGSLPSALTKIIVEVSVGELLDKLTILEIKAERINDPQKLRNILVELRAIAQTVTAIPDSPELGYLVQTLKATNEKLWDIEDAIRAKEALKEFDQEFIQLSRDVYFVNDERGRIKRDINILLGSHLIEEKQYTHYDHEHN